MEFVALLIAATEITTPAVNIRFVLTKLGLRRSRAYTINGFYFFFGFLIVRVGVTPLIVWTWFSWPSAELALVPLFMRVAFWIALAIATVLNYYWFYLIAKGALKLVLHGHKEVAEEVDGVSAKNE